jgi:multiple antibiotic resistance protein
MNALRFFPLAFSALLPVVNPLGSALVFMTLVGPAAPAVYKRLAWKIALTSVFLLTICDLFGARILWFFGISSGVVQLAGGAVLAAMGWGLLNQKDEAKAASSAPAASLESLDGQVFYPFTFPLTIGPGCIVVALTLGAHARGHVVVAQQLLAQIGILAAIVLNCALVYLAYGYAPLIKQKLSAQTIQGIQRLIAFILVCIGSQIAWNGLEDLVRGMHPG